MEFHYYDPMFALCSDAMPFNIRIEVRLTDPVDGVALTQAANRAIRRFPYFSVRVEKQEEEFVCVPNSRPIPVLKGQTIPPLGSDALDGHLLALAYYENCIYFFASHVITDGCGFFPFLKSALYEYLCIRQNTCLDPEDIDTESTPFFPDELGNPYPEALMEAATPFFLPRETPFFRLAEGGLLTDSTPTTYRLRIREADAMAFNHDHDGSPCVLVSSLMTKAIWSLHPEETRDIVSAISFNLRPGLGNQHSYRMLCSALPLHYPASLKDADIAKLCTCSRGMVSLQSQPENVLYTAQIRRRQLEALHALPDLKAKREILGKRALEDATNNTFSVSYVGKVNFGSIEPYLESIYNVTDGSTYRTLFLEISAVGGWFNIAFLQGFSTDVYYRAFLRELTSHGLSYVEEPSSPMGVPGICLPE